MSVNIAEPASAAAEESRELGVTKDARRTPDPRCKCRCPIPWPARVHCPVPTRNLASDFPPCLRNYRASTGDAACNRRTFARFVGNSTRSGRGGAAQRQMDRCCLRRALGAELASGRPSQRRLALPRSDGPAGRRVEPGRRLRSRQFRRGRRLGALGVFVVKDGKSGELDSCEAGRQRWSPTRYASGLATIQVAFPFVSIRNTRTLTLNLSDSRSRGRQSSRVQLETRHEPERRICICRP
jgi:hypothetical protein